MKKCVNLKLELMKNYDQKKLHRMCEACAMRLVIIIIIIIIYIYTIFIIKFHFLDWILMWFKNTPKSYV